MRQHIQPYKRTGSRDWAHWFAALSVGWCRSSKIKYHEPRNHTRARDWRHPYHDRSDKGHRLSQSWSGLTRPDCRCSGSQARFQCHHCFAERKPKGPHWGL